MRMQTLSIMALALLTLSAAASAAESAGYYYNHTISESKTTLPNGNTSVLSQFYNQGASNNANDPVKNTAGNCSSNAIVSKQGKVLSATGICFRQDVDGNSFSYWWKMDEDGTAKCPSMCGSVGILGGTGKFKGMTGHGTFVQTHDFGDGSSGTSRLSYQMP